jgi:hypothetical protein
VLARGDAPAIGVDGPPGEKRGDPLRLRRCRYSSFLSCTDAARQLVAGCKWLAAPLAEH